MRALAPYVCGWLACLLSTLAAAQNGTQTSTAPPCAVSSDPEYGFTGPKAVKVGGGAMYVAARERAYLDGLRGPGGEAVTARRTGSRPLSTNSQVILDTWEVSWAGAPSPTTLFLNAYAYGEPKAPVGLTCVGFRLGPPPIDFVLSQRLQADLAITQGVERAFDPILLDPAGAAVRGVAFDRFRRLAMASRSAAIAGAKLTANDAAAIRAASNLVIVAYPIRCGETTASASTIEIGNQQGGMVRSVGSTISGADLAKLLPEQKFPDRSVGIVSSLQAFRPNDMVRITYEAAACEEAARAVVLPITITPAKGVTMPNPILPAGASVPDEAVWFQVVVDPDGALRLGTHIGGPESLVPAALDALRQWRAEPMRVNGVPVVTDTLVTFPFR